MKKTILLPLAAVIIFSFLFVIACEQENENSDSEDDGSSGGDCSGEPGNIPGTPYPADDVWQPVIGTSWQWQLSGTLDLSFDVEMYDLDLFDTPLETFNELKDDGKIVICYFSAGTYEDWREDAGEFSEDVLGNPMEEWEGEWWVDIRSEKVRAIMQSRLDLAVDKGCDGVEPDNMDGYSNKNGLGLSAENQVEYNRYIADEAHKRGLSVGLKNDVCQLNNLVDWFDWALNEECFAYDECYHYEEFLDVGKAVFNVEYVDNWDNADSMAQQVCGENTQIETLIKEWDLTAKRLACSEI